MEMKVCSKCGEEKSVEEFNKNSAKKDGLCLYCKACIRLYTLEHKDAKRQYNLEHKEELANKKKVWYQKNKDIINKKETGYKRKKRQEYYDRINLIKSNQPCISCGIIYPSYCMDFDHLPPFQKNFIISYGYKYDWDEVIEEIKKCELICRNCHLERTFLRKRALGISNTAGAIYKRKNAVWFYDLKEASPCMDCGKYFKYYQMEYDHIDPASKKYGIGRIITYSKNIILEEIAKCDLVCGNCHRIRTFNTLIDNYVLINKEK